VFGGLDYDNLLLEYDSDRAGTFEPLRFVPKDKVVVMGLVTTKSGELESQETLLKRIDEAARYIPLEQLALSPQCGFASTMAGNPLSVDEERRKLELVVETTDASGARFQTSWRCSEVVESATVEHRLSRH
jgi:5-methyltetrahydropteroyltriglutamate--homocysteine methyltransferase